MVNPFKNCMQIKLGSVLSKQHVLCMYNGGELLNEEKRVIFIRDQR